MAPIQISVIMSVYNQQNYLPSAVKSILSQTYKHFEFIIVNDASTDRSMEIIKSFKDKRIKLLSNRNRLGLTKSLNKAIRIAKGKYIARMDADDISLPSRLKIQYHFLKNHPKITVCGSSALLIHADGRPAGKRTFPSSSTAIKNVIMKYNPILHPTVMMQKKIIDKMGAYDESLNGAEDYDLWLRLASKYMLHNYKTPLIKYRLNPQGVSWKHTKHTEIQALKARIKALRQHNYPAWQHIYLIKPLISLMVPSAIKKTIRRCMKKCFVLFIKKFEVLSAIACRLTHLTGKAKIPTHPKHLVDFGQLFYLKGLKKTDKVLDLGCHSGEHCFKASNKTKHILGLDIDKTLLHRARQEAKRRKISNVSFKVQDLEKKLSLKNNSFDVAFFLAVLEHLNNRDQVMKEIKRTLKPKGRLYISVPNRSSKWKKLQRSVGLSSYSDPDHKLEYSKQEICAFLKKHGFKNIKVLTTAYDTPYAGIIDLIGGISLTAYRYLINWKLNAGKRNPQESVAFHITATNG